MNRKEFGKISREQAREVYALLHRGRLEKSEADALIEARSIKLSSLWDHVPPWSYFYEMPFLHLLMLYLLTLCTKERLDEIKAAADPTEAFLEWSRSDPTPPGFDDWTNEDFGPFLSLTLALWFNLSAMGMLKLWLNDLIVMGRSGDEDAYFNAVLVDASAVAAPSIAHRMVRATIEGDGAFFDKLAKAIKKTRPRRPAEKYDDLRAMAELLDEAVGIKNLSPEILYDFLVKDLELYPEETQDSFRSFQQFINRLPKRAAT